MGDVGLFDERRNIIPPGIRLGGDTEAGWCKQPLLLANSQLIALQIDTLICTPSILSKYDQQSFPNIKVLAVAGEACPQA